MAHSTCDLMVVLENLVPGTRRGASCACPAVASRVAVLEFLLGRRPYASSRVRLMGDWELYSGRRGSVPSARVPMVLGMALQCPGWWHSNGDGRTGSEVTEDMHSITASSWTGAGLMSVRLLRVSPSSFEGVRRGERTGVGSTVPRSDTGHPAQHWYIAGDGCTTAGWSHNAGI
jgi:hypothetical protein